jgi:hypothetical protein
VLHNTYSNWKKSAGEFLFVCTACSKKIYKKTAQLNTGMATLLTEEKAKRSENKFFF